MSAVCVRVIRVLVAHTVLVLPFLIVLLVLIVLFIEDVDDEVVVSGMLSSLVLFRVNGNISVRAGT